MFAQDIAYYFEEHLLYQAPYKTLIIVTLTSLILFIVAFLLNGTYLITQKIKPRIYIILLIANAVIGFFVSIWSGFVLAMWWG